MINLKYERKTLRDLGGEKKNEKTEKVDTWAWLRKVDLKVGLKAVVFAAREKANYVKYHIEFK